MAQNAALLLEPDVSKWKDNQIREFLIGGRNGDARDTFLWADVAREMRKRKMGIRYDTTKYDFY
jgi:hypothetical protein